MMGSKLLNKEKYRQIGEDFHNLCRLCLTRTNLKLNIWLEEGQTRDIQENILNCLSLIVKKEDSLPKFVCNSCIDKLEDFQDFRNMCHESETLLNEYLSSAREKHTRKLSFEKSPASQETAPTPASDSGFSPLEVFIKSEAESADPLVCEETILGNICPENQPYVKTETTSSLVSPYDNDSVDSKLSSEYMEETSVCKVESVSDDSWMHFEGTTPEVPIGQNVPVEESDNDASLLSEDKDMKYSVENPDEVEGEVADPTERHETKNNMENLVKMKDISSSDSHLPLSSENFKHTSVLEQPNSNSERISKQGLLEPVTTSKSFESGTQNIHCRSSNNKNQYTCSTCNRRCASRAHLIVHTRVHSNERAFKCPICKKGFIQKKNVDIHMSVHNKEKPFNCSICNKGFVQKRDINRHMRFHTKEKHFNCSICNKDFARKIHLIEHMRVHTKEKPFNCSICHRSFATKSNFIRHKRLHIQERPFNCSICKKDFALKHHLTRHMRIHTKVKPFNCLICHRSFAEMSNFKRHKRVHTKERPFNCSNCNKDFDLKNRLIEHMRVHTKVKPFNC